MSAGDFSIRMRLAGHQQIRHFRNCVQSLAKIGGQANTSALALAPGSAQVLSDTSTPLPPCFAIAGSDLGIQVTPGDVSATRKVASRSSTACSRACNARKPNSFCLPVRARSSLSRPCPLHSQPFCQSSSFQSSLRNSKWTQTCPSSRPACSSRYRQAFARGVTQQGLTVDSTGPCSTAARDG